MSLVDYIRMLAKTDFIENNVIDVNSEKYILRTTNYIFQLYF